MVTIWVCVGSSCFLRGAPDVIKAFEALIGETMSGQVELKGTFCQELCTKGVTVRIAEKTFTAVTPRDVPRLFTEEVIPLLHEGYEGGRCVPYEGGLSEGASCEGVSSREEASCEEVPSHGEASNNEGGRLDRGKVVEMGTHHERAPNKGERGVAR